MKKWEYDILRRVKWGFDLDFETKRIAHLILERESKLVKEQLLTLEAKESALEKELERIEEELYKVRRGIRRLENKNEKLYDYKKM